MDFDMRGMKMSERKELLEWFFLNVDTLANKGRYRAFKYLKTIPAEDKEFTAKALKDLTDEEGDTEEDIVKTLPDKSEALRAYT